MWCGFSWARLHVFGLIEHLDLFPSTSWRVSCRMVVQVINGHMSGANHRVDNTRRTPNPQRPSSHLWLFIMNRKDIPALTTTMPARFVIKLLQQVQQPSYQNRLCIYRDAGSWDCLESASLAGLSSSTSHKLRKFVQFLHEPRQKVILDLVDAEVRWYGLDLYHSLHLGDHCKFDCTPWLAAIGMDVEFLESLGLDYCHHLTHLFDSRFGQYWRGQGDSSPARVPSKTFIIVKIYVWIFLLSSTSLTWLIRRMNLRSAALCGFKSARFPCSVPREPFTACFFFCEVKTCTHELCISPRRAFQCCCFPYPCFILLPFFVCWDTGRACSLAVCIVNTCAILQYYVCRVNTLVPTLECCTVTFVVVSHRSER